MPIFGDFWSLSLFSCIRTEYGDLLCRSLYLVQMRENTNLKIFKYGQHLRSNQPEIIVSFWVFSRKSSHSKIQRVWLISLSLIKYNQASIYFLKNNIGNTKIICKICSAVSFVNKIVQRYYTRKWMKANREWSTWISPI